MINSGCKKNQFAGIVGVFLMNKFLNMNKERIQIEKAY